MAEYTPVVVDDSEIRYTFTLEPEGADDQKKTRTLSTPGFNIFDTTTSGQASLEAAQNAALSFAEWVVGSQSYLVQTASWKDIGDSGNIGDADVIYHTVKVTPEFVTERRIVFEPDSGEE